jgi:hypothetical protein
MSVHDQMMHDLVQLAIAAGMVASAFFGYLASKRAGEAKQLIIEVHEATNSMKDELVAATAKASHAEGMQDQRKEDAQKP